MKELYGEIFRRKSVRKFDEALRITEQEKADLLEFIEQLRPLDADIKVSCRLVAASETNARQGEYCLVLFSEKKPGYLQNAGYLLEQADLWLEQRDIGVCWFGLGRPPKRKLDGLNYVIMLYFGKSRPEDFRGAVSEFTRRELAEIWRGDFDPRVTQAVRLAPSACNSQPWRFVCEGDSVRAYRQVRQRSSIPQMLRPYFNNIDMGIALCFLEAALEEKGVYSPERRTRKPKPTKTACSQ